MEPNALIRRAQTGDAGALSQLCAQAHPRLCRYLMALTRSREAAEDLAQETLLAMLRALPDFRGAGAEKFDAWLFRIARNKFLSERRKKRPDPLPEGFDPPDPAPAPEAALLRRESRRALFRALDRLDPELREMVALRYGAELSYAQIARCLRISRVRVKWRLSDARERLRRLMEEDER